MNQGGLGCRSPRVITWAEHATEAGIRRLVTVTNSAGMQWRYIFDKQGRPVTETAFDGRVHRYTYDSSGHLIEHAGPAGESVGFRRDSRGRVVERRCAGNVTRMESDRHGRLVAVSNADAVVRLERDSRGRVVADTINGRTVTTTYDDDLLIGRATPRRPGEQVELQRPQPAGHAVYRGSSNSVRVGRGSPRDSPADRGGGRSPSVL